MSNAKVTGQVDALVEYNVYGRPESATKEKPMFIGRVVTVGNHRAGFEPIATFNTPDDGAQYSEYVEELKRQAARHEWIMHLLKSSGPERALVELKKYLEKA